MVISRCHWNISAKYRILVECQAFESTLGLHTEELAWKVPLKRIAIPVHETASDFSDDVIVVGQTLCINAIDRTGEIFQQD